MSIFQFHKGAIRTHYFVDVTVERLQFQFHKGAIRTFINLHTCSKASNFNSIKVRLEHIVVRIVKVKSNRFQFHKGAIRTITTSKIA